MLPLECYTRMNSLETWVNGCLLTKLYSVPEGNFTQAKVLLCLDQPGSLNLDDVLPSTQISRIYLLISWQTLNTSKCHIFSKYLGFSTCMLDNTYQTLYILTLLWNLTFTVTTNIDFCHRRDAKRVFIKYGERGVYLGPQK